MSPPPNPLGGPGGCRYQYLSNHQYFDPLAGPKKRSSKDTNEVCDSPPAFADVCGDND